MLTTYPETPQRLAELKDKLGKALHAQGLAQAANAQWADYYNRAALKTATSRVASARRAIRVWEATEEGRAHRAAVQAYKAEQAEQALAKIRAARENGSH